MELLMDKVKRFLKTEVVLSIIIPLIISLFSYVAAQAKYTERLGMAEQNVKELQVLDKETTTHLQEHMLQNQKDSDNLLMEIKVIDAKLDLIRDDVKEVKRQHVQQMQQHGH